MTKTQEVLKRINILLYQMSEGKGEVERAYTKKATDEIDAIIDEIK